MKTPTTYRVIGFGDSDYGFFNQFRWCSTLDSAEEAYEEFYANCEFGGAVLIQVNHETWQVIKEFGTEGTSVVYGPLGNFKVVRAPALQFV